MAPDLIDRLARLRLLCTDVDGVLTTGLLHYGLESGHTKAFHVRDGAATKWLQASGVQVAFISGLATPATRLRAMDLGIEDCYMGRLDKLPILHELAAKHGLDLQQTAHIGDDLQDLPILRAVGLACCPEDAADEVKAVCHWVVPVAGGHGVLRAVGEAILKAQGKWDGIVAKYA
jgi:3-deoxy-D-manno-octulosonate 8-phosphate phosphatase (KDO 8-P phosphatase)